MPSTPSTTLPRSRLKQIRLFVRYAIAGCTGGILVAPPTAEAVGLGEIVLKSALGEPFRAEIPLKIAPGEDVDTTCIRLAPIPANDSGDTPWLTRGRLTIEQTSRGNLLVISAPSVRHPAIMLAVQVRCGVSLQRDYALLLDPPVTRELQALPVANLDPEARATPLQAETKKADTSRRDGKIWVSVEGDSLESMAQKIYPEHPAKQEKFIRDWMASGRLPTGITSATAALPPGTALPLPSKPTSKQGVSRANTGVAEHQTQTASASQAARTASTKRDRLLVSDGAESNLRFSIALEDRPEMPEPERQKLKTELQLIAALDDKNAQHIELKERIKQLENLRSRLQEEARLLEGDLTAQSAVASTTQSAAIGHPVAASADVGGSSTPPLKVETRQKTGEDWYRNSYILVSLLALVAGAIAAAMLFLQKRRPEAAAADITETEDVSGPAAAEASLPVEGDPMMEPLTEADIWPEVPEPPSDATVKAIEGAIGPLASAAPSTLMYSDGEDEHDSAVELADIMMSFGRVQGAAQTLADFIRANPKQAVKPWVKLLEVYRVANMRMEFEALTAQMHKTFNIKPVVWDDFEVAMHALESLEDLPHIRVRLCELWGQPACQAYLHDLLRDNRQGTRQGFPLAIVDEVLLLLAILDARLGPYRPEKAGSVDHELSPTTLPIPATPIPGLQSSAQIGPALSLPEPPPPLTNSLDFDLIDMDALSRTLHINLDELGDSSSEVLKR